MSAAILAQYDGSSIAGTSAVYWGAVLAMLALRSADITRFDGLTADGEPASRDHLRKYFIRVGLVAVALYALALSIRV